jgi:hypothetical protein
MARYRLLSAAVIDDALLEAGTEIEFDGIPGRHMQLLSGRGKEVPAPAPLDPAFLAHREDKTIPGFPGIFTGFSGFPAGNPPTNVDVPYVGGEGTVGETLTCTMGNWEGEPTEYAYVWRSDDEPNGETGNEYTILDADAGHTITCVVTATNKWGSTTAPPSNGVEVSAPSRRTTGGSHRG